MKNRSLKGILKKALNVQNDDQLDTLIPGKEIALENRYWLFVDIEVVFTTNSEGAAVTVRNQILSEGKDGLVVLFDAEKRKFL